jgi:Ca2+-transporting ATPase
MVLLDDNFATIVAAVREGRTIYDNIRKFIKYTLTSNAGEIWVMLLAPLAGMPLPLLPLQILWINLVTDGLPGLAMGVEPAERDTMRRPPFHPQENIFGRGLGRHVAWVGLLMGLVSLGIGYWTWRAGWENWQTMTFTTLTLSQMGHALAVRSRESLFRVGLMSNRALLGAVALTFVLQMAVIYLPFLQDLFRTRALSAGELLLSLVLSTLVFWAVELEKWLMRRDKREVR